MKQDGEQQGVAVKVPASADWLQQARSLRPGAVEHFRSVSGRPSVLPQTQRRLRPRKIPEKAYMVKPLTLQQVVLLSQSKQVPDQAGIYAAATTLREHTMVRSSLCCG